MCSSNRRCFYFLLPRIRSCRNELAVTPRVLFVCLFVLPQVLKSQGIRVPVSWNKATGSTGKQSPLLRINACWRDKASPNRQRPAPQGPQSCLQCPGSSPRKVGCWGCGGDAPLEGAALNPLGGILTSEWPAPSQFHA